MDDIKNLFFADKYNCRIKSLPDGTIIEILLCNRPIWSDGELYHSEEKKKSKKYKSADRDVSSSVRRAKHKIYDYVVSNPDLDLYITLTLNKEQVDRYDYNSVIKKLNVWLDNRVRRKGLKYVLVPELHKDGAIHFHGFFNSSACKLVDSGHKYNDGRTIYNLSDFTLGFTAGIHTVGSRARIGNYICKYITKQVTSGKIGGRYYLSGGELSSPILSYDYKDFTESFKDVVPFEIENTNLVFKRLDLSSDV